MLRFGRIASDVVRGMNVTQSVRGKGWAHSYAIKMPVPFWMSSPFPSLTRAGSCDALCVLDVRYRGNGEY